MQNPTRTSLVVLAAAALIAIGSAGHAVADRLITGHDIRNGSITGKDVRDSSIGSRKLKPQTIQLQDLSVPLQSRVLREPAPGLTFHEFDTAVRAGVSAGATAEAVCPPGKVAIGGGYELTSDPTGWAETASFPGHVDEAGVRAGARNAWVVKLAGPAGQTADVTVYASCAYDFQ